MEYFAQQVFNGLAIAGIYALVAIGISLIWGLTRLINFSHGEMLMIGSFVAITAYSFSQSFWVAAVVGTVAVGLLGVVLERGLFRFTLHEPINGFILSLGLIVVLQNVAVLVWGSRVQTLRPPFSGVVNFLGVFMPTQRLFVLVITLVLLAAFMVLLRRTRAGKVLRAAAEEPEAAALLGVPIGLIITIVFMIGSAVAGLGGVLFASLFPVTPFLGGHIVIKGFAVALIGGLGSISGVAVGALILGLGEALFAGYLATQWTAAVSFGLMVGILLLRPSGLFRGTEAA